VDYNEETVRHLASVLHACGFTLVEREIEEGARCD